MYQLVLARNILTPFKVWESIEWRIVLLLHGPWGMSDLDLYFTAMAQCPWK